MMVSNGLDPTHLDPDAIHTNVHKYFIRNGYPITADTVNIHVLRRKDSLADVLDNILDNDPKADVLEKLIYCYCLCGEPTGTKLELISKVLSKNPNVNFLHNSENIKIFYAVCDPKIYQLLVDHGLNINANDPLFRACGECNYPLVDYLLGQGMEVDQTILQLMMYHFCKEIVDILIKYHIDLSQLPQLPVDESVLPSWLDLGKLEENGLNKNVLNTYLLFSMHDKWFDNSWYDKLCEKRKNN